MTTFIARSGEHDTDTTAALRAAAQRFSHAVVSLGSVALGAIEATRALGSAHTVAGRRAALNRFAADIGRPAA